MKIITLNIWGGRIEKELLDFLNNNQEVDIFCFQEMYKDGTGKQTKYLDAKEEIFYDIEKSLPNHKGYFRPHLFDYYGLSIFIKKQLPIINEGEEYVSQQKGYVDNQEVGIHAKNIHYVTTTYNNKLLTIINFHGLWTGKGKGDTDERLIQSENIINFCEMLKNEFLVCGDFNLLPDTKSLKKFTSFGLRDLVAEYRINSTRTSFYEKENKFADYVFVSSGITVKNFSVLPDEVSDHAALLVEIDL
jgi:endonuclease/exonuclease/phosphatase family metal-dependent hydrolase